MIFIAPMNFEAWKPFHIGVIPPTSMYTTSCHVAYFHPHEGALTCGKKIDFYFFNLLCISGNSKQLLKKVKKNFGAENFGRKKLSDFFFQNIIFFSELSDLQSKLKIYWSKILPPARTPLIRLRSFIFFVYRMPIRRL